MFNLFRVFKRKQEVFSLPMNLKDILTSDELREMRKITPKDGAMIVPKHIHKKIQKAIYSGQFKPTLRYELNKS